MAFKSITRRWLFNSFSVILVILIVVIVSTSVSLRNYYYNSVRQAIDSRVRVVSNLLLRYDDGTAEQLGREIQQLVENFADRNLMELTALDQNGQPVLTSSGFELDGGITMPDYEPVSYTHLDQGVRKG